MLRSRWRIITAVVVVGLAALALLGRGPGSHYRATATLVFDETGSPPRDQFVQDLTAAAALARTPLVSNRAVDRLNALNSPADLADKITARANPADNTVVITTVPYASASTARTLADGYATELANALGDQQNSLSKRSSDAVTADQAALGDQLKTLEGKLAAAAKAPIDQQEMLRAQRDAVLRHLQDTLVANLALPRSQTLTRVGNIATTKVKKDGLAPTTVPGWMLAAGVLAILGCAIALVVERLEGRLHSRAAVERAFGLPVLADVPAFAGNGIVAATEPLSAAADAFRDVRTSLARLGRQRGRNGTGRATPLELTSAVVTSPTARDGKTTTAVNLAAVVAETGKSVLVIDCDMRAPDAHGRFGVDPGPGLSDVLLGAATMDQVAVATSVPGVRLVGAGRATQNPAALLARQEDFVAKARALADFVILDAPPLSVHDTSELVWMVDAVVIACRTGVTRVAAAEHAQEVLEVLDAPPAGVVMLTSVAADGADDATTDEDGGRERRPEASPLTPAASQAPPTPPTAPPAPEPASSTSATSSSPSPLRASSVGVLTRPASTRVQPQPAAEPEAADWATRVETEEAGADSDSIRRQLALPARRVASWAGTAALMVVMWFAIRLLLFQSFFIPSPSMSPALVPGDRVLVSKLSYRLHSVHRGDIVVFKRPPRLSAALAGPEVKDLVKRVIGLPGDTVEARDGHVIVDGRVLKEPYVPKGAVTSAVPPTLIAPNQYWVMGDNRSVSEDSRYFGS
ncbi:MAG: signal peptidase I, partial [Acidimicrobiia bacterium]|nr:signal peptidase I [Acidimicrobiia bacterium]